MLAFRPRRRGTSPKPSSRASSGAAPGTRVAADVPHWTPPPLDDRIARGAGRRRRAGSVPSARRWSKRVSAAGERGRAAAAGTQADGRRRRRLRLRQPEPAHLSARRRVADVVGRERQRRAGRSSTAAARAARSPKPPRSRARPRRGSPTSIASLALEIRQRLREIEASRAAIDAADDARPQRDRSAPRASASASPPASRPAPTCSMRRSRCCRPSSIARRRSPTRTSRTRRLARALGR